MTSLMRSVFACVVIFLLANPSAADIAFVDIGRNGSFMGTEYWNGWNTVGSFTPLAIDGTTTSSVTLTTTNDFGWVYNQGHNLAYTVTVGGTVYSIPASVERENAGINRANQGDLDGSPRDGFGTIRLSSSQPQDFIVTILSSISAAPSDTEINAGGTWDYINNTFQGGQTVVMDSAAGETVSLNVESTWNAALGAYMANLHFNNTNLTSGDSSVAGMNAIMVETVSKTTAPAEALPVDIGVNFLRSGNTGPSLGWNNTPVATDVSSITPGTTYALTDRFDAPTNITMTVENAFGWEWQQGSNTNRVIDTGSDLGTVVIPGRASFWFAGDNSSNASRDSLATLGFSTPDEGTFDLLVVSDGSGLSNATDTMVNVGGEWDSLAGDFVGGVSDWLDINTGSGATGAGTIDWVLFEDIEPVWSDAEGQWSFDLNVFNPTGGTSGGGISALYLRFNVIPEPSAIVLAGLGLLGLCLRRRRRK